MRGAGSSTSRRPPSPRSPPPPTASSRSVSPGEPVGRGRLTELINRHGVRPSRALGQNFLADPNTAERIARLAGIGPGQRVVEIGAGLGSLTAALAATGASVTAIELDHRLAEILRSETAPPGVRVVEGDALRLDWHSVLGAADGPGGAGEAGGAGAAEEIGGAGAGAAPWVLVANLPYNVATPLVIGLLETVPAIGRMLVMVQREVGERMAASAGEEPYGGVSAKIAYWATARVVGRVPPTVFIPRPKVESALVSVERRPVPAVGDGVSYARLVHLINAGFSKRRKMLRGSLSGMVDDSAFALARIEPTARAEDLSIEDWGRLAAASPGAEQ
ncbi:MAG: 16S rRNA (adenine(1518)-N(6)/adenine(1519)-N(6))-dimethyltransferase RsmA [Acidimicrobiales bacterium]